jgi:5-(aminomethyl)-3-furanmethanol phosphate kinase
MSDLIERLVVKIGGATLFQSNGFVRELNALLRENKGSQIWLIVGGGDLVEALRTVHRIYPDLDHEELHWRCVELLDHTWAIAKKVYGSGIAIERTEELAMYSQQQSTPGLLWVRIQSFYSRAESHSLPIAWQPSANWNTTTDALAWLLGKKIDADRVLLIKQCECDQNWTFSEAAKLGVIDSELARLSEVNPSVRPAVQLRKLNL